MLKKVLKNKKGKMDPNWEGSYKVKVVIRAGAYELKETNGKKVLRPWNTAHLRTHYH